jgi:hypothetical protein
MPIRESVSRESNAGYGRKTLVLRRRLLCFEAVIVSIAELDLFEPADGIALVGNDLRLPQQGDRHGSHD